MFNGARVRELRGKRNYSQVELAQKAGISTSFLSELERGNRRPSLGTIDKLAAVLNVPPGELMAKKPGGGSSPGEQVRSFRRDKDYSLQELAGLTGLSYSYLCGIERGLVAPSIDSLKNISAVLEVSPKELLSAGLSLGRRLTGVREDHGLNRSQLARKAGLSPGMIGQIERDKVQPSLQTIEQIAAALNISPCYFIAEENGVEELLHLLTPEVRSLLLDEKVQSLLRTLCQCNEKEFRLILDFIALLKQANLCEHD